MIQVDIHMKTDEPRCIWLKDSHAVALYVTPHAIVYVSSPEQAEQLIETSLEVLELFRAQADVVWDELPDELGVSHAG